MKRFIYICVLIVGASLLGSNAIVAQNNATAEAVVKRAISELKKRAYHSSFSLIYYKQLRKRGYAGLCKCNYAGRQFKMRCRYENLLCSYQWCFGADTSYTVRKLSDV